MFAMQLKMKIFHLNLFHRLEHRPPDDKHPQKVHSCALIFVLGLNWSWNLACSLQNQTHTRSCQENEALQQQKKYRCHRLSRYCLQYIFDKSVCFDIFAPSRVASSLTLPPSSPRHKRHFSRFSMHEFQCGT